MIRRFIFGIKKNWLRSLLGLLAILGGSLVLFFLYIYIFVGSPTDFFRFAYIYRTVKQEYYQPVSDAQLWQGAEGGMISSLGDPHSTMLTGDLLRIFQEQTDGHYSGVGIVLGEDKDQTVHILSVLPGSPAEKAGLQSGDTLESINGQSTKGLDISRISSLVRGPAGSGVQLSVDRNENALDFSLQRSDIILPTVDSRMMNDHIGYIHIFSFAENTPDEVRTALEKLRADGAGRLIIDLRMNPGGMVTAVTQVASQLLSKGPVVSYQLRNGKTQTFSIDGISNPLPMVFLIDRNSASASEILASAAQDRHEGIIMGEKSYGKGTVQQVIYQDQSSLIKITVAEYKTADGHTIDKIGVKPDIPVEQNGQAFDVSSDTVLQAAVSYLENHETTS